jgi:predicted N-acyltransferase
MGMADQEREFVAKIASGVAGLNARAWDRLAGTDPFVSHAFLSSLEDSVSVGPGTGWTPAPILIEDEGSHLIAAAPAYLKSHSQGEYVFDHGWAEAWERAGGEYYPKLQVAVPFTPVPGPRLLGSCPQHVLAAIEAVAVQNALSSAHLTFVDEPGASEAARRGWLMRHGIQYHWLNRGYASFDDFLDRLTSRKRKAIRKERDAAREGLEFRLLRGADIGAAERDAMWAFYQDTGGRKWGQPYLTREFFDLVGERMGDAVLLFLACRGSQPIAGALNFVSEQTLYGRYWGCTEEMHFLHFELCYYQAIEWAIEHGLTAVQAGAQGEHKIARGYEPVITKSAHFIPNKSFREAIADFLESERAAIATELTWLREQLPYKSAPLQGCAAEAHSSA